MNTYKALIAAAEYLDCLNDSDKHDYYADAIAIYKDWRGDMLAAEMAYFDHRGVLPEWATVVERVEIVEGNRLYIHRG